MTRILATLMFSGLSIAAFAQPGSGGAACRPDVQQYCSSAAGGGGEQVKDCLIDHQKEISDACYDFLSKQKSGDARSEGNATDSRPAAPNTQIYRSRHANGSTIYSDTLQPNAVAVRKIQIDNANSALPFR